LSAAPIKLGVLQAGGPPARLADRYASYAVMFERLLGPGAYDYRTFDVRAGDFPKQPEACDAYIVTGSSAGAYEPDPWIAALKRFLVEAKGRAALVGVCFGHQIMAEAFGGRVIKSPKGWGVGLHTYEILARRPWMDEASAISLPASHQDQVVEAPPATTILAGSAFSPFGMLAYDDQPAISIQLHPEFDAAYAKALIEGRRGTRLSVAQTDAAIASLDAPNDSERVGGWIGRFIEGVAARR
jgi:GMP synthase-like glutamine amidotransferase